MTEENRRQNLADELARGRDSLAASQALLDIGLRGQRRVAVPERQVDVRLGQHQTPCRSLGAGLPFCASCRTGNLTQGGRSPRHIP